MIVSTDLIYDTKRKILAKYPRFGSEIAVANIEFKENLTYHTAATDGKNVYVDPNYFESLSENDRLFTISHEVMHIKFIHMFRLMDKDGKRRNMKLWNIATDAVINANLERDGFTIPEGYVNMPEALNYSAEEFYQKLLEEKEKKQNGQKQEQGDGQKQGQDSGQGQEQDGDQKREQKDKQSQNQDNSKKKEKKDEQENRQDKNKEKSDKDENQNANEGKYQGDDHSLWEEAFKQQQDSKKKGEKQSNTQKKQKQQQAQQQEQIGEEQTDMDFDEREEFEENRIEKREKFKARRKNIQKDIRSTGKEKIKLENIGESKEAIDWKVLLRREVEKTETIWSQRRSIAENNYVYRLEENDIEDDAETEVMVDVSGSVDLELVKAFLRQIKPLLKQSKLRVGCFDTKFWGFVDINNLKDIDNFNVPRGGATDLDLPVRSFTKKREINKIVFTDGYANR